VHAKVSNSGFLSQLQECATCDVAIAGGSARRPKTRRFSPALTLKFNFPTVAKTAWRALALGETSDRQFDAMTNVQALVAEFDTVLRKASISRGTTILRQVLDLFLERAPSYSDDQIAVFGVITNLLIGKVERQAVIELSSRLASVDHVPADVIKRLSWDDDIAISGPILGRYKAISDADILDIAEAKSPAHLLAIACRSAIDEATTDVLLNRGNPEVMRKVADNKSARFSEIGYVKLITQAQHNKELALSIKKREDIPDELQSFLKMALA
jgi:uncharacterized protein (DUF2336 family)